MMSPKTTMPMRNGESMMTRYRAPPRLRPVLRKDPRGEKDHFRAPTILPVIGAIVSLAMMTTKDGEIFMRAGILLLVGAALWVVTWYAHGRHQSAMDTGVLKTVSRPD